ncbi:HEAT repeat domain-containing protein [Limnoglobus roseus]|uniref:HEAT repeat domain-containing protein n=1 Tax=Limnoglobus roseus TaxID=2598579 RepID=A0A5C1A9T1_9BACT|nr:HEAT repeat domain-containing protein [Limnoglobus roseus]QEL15325.1 HEAT repeat domain-containing protein [Limnoglobus roseus]
MRRFLATVGTLAVGVGGAIAADAVKPREDAAALVQKLGDPQFPVREQAAKGLLKIGATAIPSVQDVINTTADPGVRERAEALLPRLHLMAESERFLAPKLVKLDYQNMALSAVVDDLKKKTGINLMLENVAAPTRSITLTGGDVPAWQAVEMLCAAATLREDHRLDLPVPTAGGETHTARQFGRNNVYYLSGSAAQTVFTPGSAPVVLVDGKADVLPGNRATAVRVLALPGKFEGNRVIRGSGTVILNLDVAPLPSVNWPGSPTVRVTRAEDEDGRPLFADQKADPRPQMNNPYGWGGGFGGGLWLGGDYEYVNQPTTRGNNPRLTPVTLRTDDRAIRSLKRFEGVVVGEVNQPNQPVITIDGMDKLVGKSFDGPNQTKLSVASYQVGKDGSVVVKIHAEMPQQWVFQQRLGGRLWNGNLNDDLNIGNIPNKLKFTDADGKPCPTPSQRSTSYSGNQWNQTFDSELHFPKSSKGGPPTKVVLTGTKVATVEIPFAMENVKLP